MVFNKNVAIKHFNDRDRTHELNQRKKLIRNAQLYQRGIRIANEDAQLKEICAQLEKGVKIRITKRQYDKLDYTHRQLYLFNGRQF